MNKSGRNSASALLQRASSQLKGEKVVDDDEGIDAYLSSLTKKKTTEQPIIEWDKFDQSDISIESDVKSSPKRASGSTSPALGGGSKFLKKKAKLLSPKEKKDASRSKHMKKTDTSVNTTATKSLGKSSVLNKAASYTSKYGGSATTGLGIQGLSGLSDSDMDLSLSMDEDVIADARSWKKTQEKVSPVKQVVADQKKNPPYAAVPMRKQPSPQYKFMSDDDSSSMQIGKGGNRFLKKQKKEPPPPQSESDVEDIDEDIKLPTHSAPTAQMVGGQHKSMFGLKSAEKYSTKVVLDTDEESMADFIGGLSETSSGGATPRAGHHSPKTPRGILKTPHSDRTPTIEELPEEDNILHIHQEEPLDTEEDTISSADDFKFNVMDFDMLEPVPEHASSSRPKTDKLKKGDSGKNKKKQSKTDPTNISKSKKEKKTETKQQKEPDFFSSMGLQTMEDLLGMPMDKDESDISEIQTAATSEIKTVDDDYDSDFEPTSKSGRPSTPLKSILTTTPRPTTPKSGRGRVRLALENEVKHRSRSPSPEIISTARGSKTASMVYTDEFDDETIRTEANTETSIKTESVRSETSEKNSSSYSDDTITSERSSPRVRRRQSNDYYSDDFTDASQSSVKRSSRRLSRSSSHDSVGSYSDDYTSYTSSHSRSPSPVTRPKIKVKSREVQTGLDVGLAYHWNSEMAGHPGVTAGLGLGLVDPTPIATHVVSADALEALTSYNPAAIALHDMMRQQLQLTRQFVNMQKHLHDSLLASAPAQHSYITLEDTKKYIKKHKKPIITFDEALKQVKGEMGLK